MPKRLAPEHFTSRRHRRPISSSMLKVPSKFVKDEIRGICVRGAQCVMVSNGPLRCDRYSRAVLFLIYTVLRISLH